VQAVLIPQLSDDLSDKGDDINGIVHLDLGKGIRTGFGFAHFALNSFRVLFARQLEESLPVAIEVFHIQQVRVVWWSQPMQPPLASALTRTDPGLLSKNDAGE
jgi:hypothetical protein